MIEFKKVEPKSFVGAAKEKHKKHRTLKFLLHRHLAGYHKERSHKVVHASDVSPLSKADWTGTKFCAREFALMDLTKTTPKDYFLTTSLAMTFGLGRDIETRVVNLFADMGRAVGHWRCVACDLGYDFMKRPVKCSRCGSTKFDHVEVVFKSKVSGVTCGVDLLVDAGKTKLVLTEIKSMTPDQFRDLKGPLAEHRWRTNLYMRVVDEADTPASCERASRINTQEAVVLYVSKSGYGALDPSIKKSGLIDGRHSPFKEFLIKRDDVATQSGVDDAVAVKVFRDGGPVPGRICPNAMCKRAKVCGMIKPCFSGDY